MLRTSERGVEFIKRQEGFVAKAQWDYAQYSIGYGSHCNPADYPDGITREEADKLLRLELGTEMEPVVAKVERVRGSRFQQCEWDALVSLTYNLGAQWLKGRCYQYIIGAYPMNETDFIASLEAWSKAGGETLPGLLRRRTHEARLYLYGDYADGQPYCKEEEMRYEKLKDIKSEAYRKTIDKLLALGYLAGKGGEGEETIIDLGEDAVRLLVILDRASVFDGNKTRDDIPTVHIDLNKLGKLVADEIGQRIVNG